MRQLASTLLAATIYLALVSCGNVAAAVTGFNTTDTNNTLHNSSRSSEIGVKSNETEALEFLKEFDFASGEDQNEVTIAEWNVETNITDDNEKLLVERQSDSARFDKVTRSIALTFNASAMSADTQRQLSKIKNIGTSAQPDPKKVAELSQTMADMESIYGKAKVCLKKDQCLPLEPDITRLMATLRDYDTLLALWVGWRNETGRKMKSLYTKYVELSNEAVKFLGFNDSGEEWRSVYESDTFIDDVKDLFDQVAPLYEQLHAYVRRRLKAVYNESRFPASGHIPAHILGDMWAQEWDNLIDLLKPYQNKTAMDVTEEMVRQNYTVERIFRTAEGFFTSLGFDPMVPTFWNLSMLEKPTDGREVVCHASAWDFYDQRDFRIKMCTDITQQDLMTAHHEMGHIEYFMQYSNQPVIYRDGANDGFHEAVGDVMALSVQTPEHMKRLNLIKEIPTDDETDINFLMNMALQKVAFLPFGYLIDQWRWSVFSGQTSPDRYNRDWWSLRCHYQGVSPPVARSEDDFDPGAKYHVAAGVPYLRYFISFIIQFQFQQAACQAANHTGPLHRCDIYNNTAAGQKLRDMLKLGSSKPWPEAMKLLTGQEKMSAEPLMEYFKPLLHFLRKENGNDFGWDPQCPIVTRTGEPGKQVPTPTCTKDGNSAERTSFSLIALLIAFVIRLL